MKKHLTFETFDLGYTILGYNTQRLKKPNSKFLSILTTEEQAFIEFWATKECLNSELF